MQAGGRFRAACAALGKSLEFSVLEFPFCIMLWEHERTNSFWAVWGTLLKEMTFELF